MTTWAILAPGPSATAAQAQLVHEAGIPIGAVGCAYQLAPMARFVASSDRAWWRNYTAAFKFPARYSMIQLPDVEHVKIDGMESCVNSGVLGLEIAKRMGATTILLLGCDMKGSHFFGQYTNGLRNASAAQRKQHLSQYQRWGVLNKGIRVVNCTQGSALTCFQMSSLDAFLEQFVPHSIAIQV
jgi:hypothetical protein